MIGFAWLLLIGGAILLAIIAFSIWDERKYQREKLAAQRDRHYLATAQWKQAQAALADADDSR